MVICYKFIECFFKRIASVLNRYIFDILSCIQASPLIPVIFRRKFLKIIIRSIGVGCYINPHVRITNPNIIIGDYCAIGPGSHLDGTGVLCIGNRVHLGPNVIVLTGTHKIMPSVYRRDRFERTVLSTMLGDGVWLCSGSTVLAGVKIGEGCVIGAGSVVVRDCEPNTLYAGNPAKKIRSLEVKTRYPFENGKEVSV